LVFRTRSAMRVVSLAAAGEAARKKAARRANFM
jgi:hypothetical protein